jgi:AraC-like DNA-binding protein
MPKGLAALVCQGMVRFRDEGKSEGLSAALAAVCAELLSATPEARPHALRERRFLISEFFTRHYQEDVTLSDLAALLCLGEKQTARLLREETGRTFREELTAYRREAALMLMKEGKYSLSEIAERVGFGNVSDFYRMFRKLHGIAPYEYKKSKA